MTHSLCVYEVMKLTRYPTYEETQFDFTSPDVDYELTTFYHFI